MKFKSRAQTVSEELLVAAGVSFVEIITQALMHIVTSKCEQWHMQNNLNMSDKWIWILMNISISNRWLQWEFPAVLWKDWNELASTCTEYSTDRAVLLVQHVRMTQCSYIFHLSLPMNTNKTNFGALYLYTQPWRMTALVWTVNSPLALRTLLRNKVLPYTCAKTNRGGAQC